MEYRNLGRSGLLVSVVGLGCHNFGHRGAVDEISYSALHLPPVPRSVHDGDKGG